MPKVLYVNVIIIKLMNLEKYKDNKYFLIGFLVLIIIVISTAGYLLFTSSDHLTNDYEVNSEIASVDKTNQSATINGDSEVTGIYIISESTNTETKISDSNEAFFEVREPTRVTIIAETQGGEKYIIDTVKFEDSINISTNVG